MNLRYLKLSALVVIVVAVLAAFNGRSTAVHEAMSDWQVMPGDTDTVSEGRAASITFGPYLQNVKATSITVMWYTDQAVVGTVEYGLNTSYGATRSDPGATSVHEIILTDLKPSTTYHYRIVGTNASQDHTFRTADATISPYKFLVYGEAMQNHTVHTEIINAMLNESARFVINTGDLVSNGTTASEWPSFFQDIGPLASNISYYTTLGEHDGNSQYYYNYLSLPGNERWYSFDYGQVHFICLDTNSYTDYMPGSQQYNWLVNDLATNQQDWKFRVVYFNQPPYSGSNREPNTLIQNTFDQLFVDNNVQLVLNGQDHYYCHSVKNGINYVVTGGGGAPLDDPYENGDRNWIVYAESTYHYCRVSVLNGFMKVEAVKLNGTVIDSFTLEVPNKAPADIGCWAQDKAYDNGGAIDVNWDQCADDGGGENDVTAYMLFRSTDGSHWNQIGTFQPGTTHYEDTSVTTGQSYYYYVVVTDGVYYVGSTVAGPVTAIDDTVPDPPTNLVASDVPNDKGSHIQLSWIKSIAPDVKEYIIYRDTSQSSFPESTKLTAVPYTEDSWIDANASDNQPYFYALRAFDGTHLSALSNIAGPVASKWDKAPMPPSNFRAEDVPNDDGGSIHLSWSKSTGDRPLGDVTEYHIYRAVGYPAFGNVPNITVSAGTTEYIDTDLDPNVDYYYRIFSFDGYLESEDYDMAGPVKAADNNIPAAVTEITTKNVKDTGLTLVWQPSPSTSTAGYRIYINTSAVYDNIMDGKYDGEWRQLDIVEDNSSPSYDVSGLSSSTTYCFTVQPYSSSGKGPDLSLCPQVIETTLSPPIISKTEVMPSHLTNKAGAHVYIIITVDDADGTGDIMSVIVDLSNISATLGSQPALNDGNYPDEQPEDNIFYVMFDVPDGLEPGDYSVTITSKDMSFLERTKTITLHFDDWKSYINEKPQIISFSPEQTVISLSMGDNQTFSVSASDPDGDNLTITWYLDSTKVGEGREVTLSPVKSGDHIVRAVVSDGDKETEATWHLNMVENESTNTDTGGISEDNKESGGKGNTAYYIAGAVLVLLVIGAAVGIVIYLSKKRNPKQVSPEVSKQPEKVEKVKVVQEPVDEEDK